MKKIAKLTPANAPEIAVYYNEKAKCNPYRVYTEWDFEALSPAGGAKVYRRKKRVGQFADLASAIYQAYAYALLHNEEHRED